MTIVNENICTVYDNKQPITVKHLQNWKQICPSDRLT